MKKKEKQERIIEFERSGLLKQLPLKPTSPYLILEKTLIIEDLKVLLGKNSLDYIKKIQRCGRRHTDIGWLLKM